MHWCYIIAACQQYHDAFCDKRVLTTILRKRLTPNKLKLDWLLDVNGVYNNNRHEVGLPMEAFLLLDSYRITAKSQTFDAKYSPRIGEGWQLC